MLKQQDLTQIRNYVIQVLPQLLRQEPEIVATIEGIIAVQFPRRDEFTRLLDELKLLREQTDVQLTLQREEIKEVRENMERRFAQVDQQLALQREEIKAVREEVNVLREEVNVLREEVKALREEVKALREDMERRFVQVDQQLALQREEIKMLREDMERRFVQVDQQFALQREEIRGLRENMERRFAQADLQRAEDRQEILKLKRGQLKLQAGQDHILKRMDGLENWLRFTVGELRNEKGKSLEDMVAAALRYGLKNPHIAPETIHLRQILEDPGRIFFPGFATEIDLIAENDKLTVFEVKATSKTSDVDLFAMKLKLVALQNPTQQVHGIFICLAPSEDIQQRCVQLGIELVS